MSDEESDNKEIATIEEQEAIDGELIPKSELLRQQSNALKRAMKRDGRGVTAIARALGVGRQTLYQWMWGQCAIPEEKVLLLCKEFDCEPAEMRYDIIVLNHSDLADIACRIEKELVKQELSLSPEKKGALVAGVYREYQNLQRVYDKDFARSEIDSRIQEIIKLTDV